MATTKRSAAVSALLDELYGGFDRCFLDYDANKPYELLFATILSAQCTDERVNFVTKSLFARYPALEDFASAELAEMERLVHSTGFYRAKAANIIATAGLLLTKHGGELPRSIGELTALPGVGRKTANIILGHVFNTPAVAVDTHVKRVSFRLGLTKHTEPDKIERDLMRIFPKSRWIRLNTQLIAFGRAVCKAQNPRCSECAFSEFCVGRLD